MIGWSGCHRGSPWLLIRPDDDPDVLEAADMADDFVGFKVNHVFADTNDTFNAETQEFLPEWVWQIADRRGLVIMLHMVRVRSLADPVNQRYIRQYCQRYPGAKLILAHAARGFCGRHTTEGIDTLRGLDNVYFETSAVCESEPLEAILHAFGPRRLMFGTDFPISESRGRYISIADGFAWLDEHNVFWEDQAFAAPTRVGIESLLALRRACQSMSLKDADIERIFRHNARQLLSIDSPPNGRRTQQTYNQAKQIIPGGTQLWLIRKKLTHCYLAEMPTIPGVFDICWCVTFFAVSHTQ